MDEDSAVLSGNGRLFTCSQGLLTGLGSSRQIAFDLRAIALNQPAKQPHPIEVTKATIAPDAINRPQRE